ncbi:MAG: RHS repeat-associated core domain-containing protein [Pseudomonadota bacterium]
MLETIHNVFDLDGNRIAEYLYNAGTGTSTLIREYIWLNGQVIGVFEGGQLFYIRSDHIGRPVFATNDLGLKVWEASYLPFGGVQASSGPNIGLRFPGQWFQSESGLHQNWMRDYDPTTGRYLQGDPLGLVDGASVYGYALQNPGRYVDPYGLMVGPNIPAPVPLPDTGDGNLFCASGDDCSDREKEERERCFRLFGEGDFHHLRACLQRAEIRRDMCNRGNPEGNQPPEWSEEEDYDPLEPWIPHDNEFWFPPIPPLIMPNPPGGGGPDNILPDLEILVSQ